MVELSKTLQLLADDTRFQIVRILAAGPATVTDLVGKLGLGQSLVSYHLSLMKDAGVVTTKTKGKWHIYALNASMEESTKALVKLIAGSDIDRSESAVQPKPSEDAAKSTARSNPRAGRRGARRTKEAGASSTATKPKVEDFEDYLL